MNRMLFEKNMFYYYLRWDIKVFLEWSYEYSFLFYKLIIDDCKYYINSL